MFQISQYFSTPFADLGDSMYRKAHGVFSFIFFSQTFQLKFTPSPDEPASPVLDTPAKFLEPSRLWFPQPSSELPSTQGFDSEFHRDLFTVIDSGLLWTIKPLILLSLLVFLCLPFSSDLRGRVSALLSLAQSFSSKFSALVHADCCKKICRADAELAKKCSALDITLQQIERGNSRIQSLVAENGSLSNLILDQGADIRIQTAAITLLEGQLDDQERVLLQATRLGEQHKREAQVNRKEVAKLKSRLASLAAESDKAQSMLTSNLHSAEIREEQLRDSLDTAATREERLRDTLRANGMLLVQVQAALRTAEDTGRAQLQTLTLESETCAMQREHWKTTAEEAELRVAVADRSMLDLRKELAVALRNVREAKEQFESQTVVIDERDATIRSLNRELAEVQGQLQGAKDGSDDLQPDFEHTVARKPKDVNDEAGNLQPDFEHADAWKPRDVKDDVDNLQPDFEHIEAWKPLDSQFEDGPPPILEWREWLTKDEAKVPILATQERSRPPHISLVELCIDGPTPIQAGATLPDEPLSCSSTPVVRSSPFDDPFVVDSLLKPRPTNPTFAVLNLAESPATPVSPSDGTEMIEDLQEQVALEQVARVDAEYRLTLQQLKVLATEAVTVVQRGQLTDLQSLLSEETAKNTSLREEIRNLKVEHGVMTEKIAQSEASLAKCQTAKFAADKASNVSRTELAKVKGMLPVLMKEADDLLSLKVERGAMMTRVAHLETSLAESQTVREAATKVADEAHAELVKVKETFSVLTNEANGLRKEARELRKETRELRKEARELKKETDGLQKERYDLEKHLSQAVLLSSALQVQVQDLEQRAANTPSTPSDERREARELKKERSDLDISQGMLLSSTLQQRVQGCEQKAVDVPSISSDERKEARNLKKERYDLDMRSYQAILLSSALQVPVQDREQKAADVPSTPSDESKGARGLKKERCDLNLSQASSAHREQVQNLEQKAANIPSTPSDESRELKNLELKAANVPSTPFDETDSGSDCSVNLVVSESVSYLLDTSLPSLSSWGSIPDPSPLDSGPFPLVKTKLGIRPLAQAAPSRNNRPVFPAKLPATPPTASHEFDGLVTSETELSLMLAATPPEPLPTLSPVTPSSSGSLSDAPSPCHLTNYPRPEDCRMPILGRVRKTRRSSPPHTSQPYPPKGKPTRR